MAMESIEWTNIKTLFSYSQQYNVTNKKLILCHSVAAILIFETITFEKHICLLNDNFQQFLHKF